VFLGKPIESLPASLLGLRFGINQLHPMTLRVSAKFFANWRSELKAAIRYGADKMALPARGTRLRPEWQALFDKMTDFYQRHGLLRFLRHCSAQGIEPDQVSDEVLRRFKSAIEAETFTVKVKDVHRRTARLWNQAAARVPGWPQISLSVPSYRAPKHGCNWSEFAAPFRKDVDDYLATREPSPDGSHSIDRLLDETKERPWSPATIRLRREQIRLAASAAVHCGIPIEQLRSLADLVKAATVEKVIRYYLERDQRSLGEARPRAFTTNLAYALLNIAKTWVRSTPDELDRLGRMFKSLSRYERRGLTEKNRATVQIALDPATRSRLFDLPAKLMADAETMKCSYRGAVKAQLAVLIGILLAAPMRAKNLMSLRIGTELIRLANGEYQITIPEHAVKNRELLEYPLPASVSALVDTYVAKFRPRLIGSEHPWLFPGERGHKGGRTALQQISGVIQKEIGLRITLHQFRHVAAAWILENDPSKIELVRRVLGHTNVATTLRYYAGLRDSGSIRAYQDIVTADQSPRGSAHALR
jgi:integrase